MYEDAIVTFFDVLGFKALVDNGPPAEVAEVLDLIAQVSSSEDGEELAPQVIAFSDSIVRVRRLEHELNQAFPLGLLFWELLALLYAQSNLVHRGVLIRGAVTVGSIHIQGARVFGPSLVEAYELESRFAQGPRLIVSPKALHSIENNPLIASQNGVEHDKGYCKPSAQIGHFGFLI